MAPTSHTNSETALLTMSSKSSEKKEESKRNLFAFWIFGFTADFAFFVMLTVAYDILSDEPTTVSVQGYFSGNLTTNFSTKTTDDDDYLQCNAISTGAVLLADNLPALIVKVLFPIFFLQIPNLVKVALISGSAIGGLLVVAFSNEVWLSLFGVALASFASGLGETTFLSLTTLYGSKAVSMWLSGMGASGLFGSVVIIGLTAVGLSLKASLIILAPVPVMMMLTYLFILTEPPPSTTEAGLLNGAVRQPSTTEAGLLNGAQRQPSTTETGILNGAQRQPSTTEAGLLNGAVRQSSTTEAGLLNGAVRQPSTTEAGLLNGAARQPSTTETGILNGAARKSSTKEAGILNGAARHARTRVVDTANGTALQPSTTEAGTLNGAARQPSTTEAGIPKGAALDSVENTQTQKDLSLRDKLFLIPSLLNYIVPLTLAYSGAYFINQGLAELLYFNDMFLSPADQYRWYQFDYQLGAFLSLSSPKYVKMDKLWVLPVLQYVNIIILLLQVIYRFIPSFYIVLVVIFWVVVVQSVNYTNTLHKLSKEVHEEYKEYAIGIVSTSTSIGISLGGLVALPIHNAVCEMNIKI